MRSFSFLVGTALAACLSLLSVASARQLPEWCDPSPHKVQLVNVDEGVKLEVLDWGGSGRALVFVPGGGDTAHVYDDFAPKLASEYHVYGITPRGIGASTGPAPDKAGNYSADRLGDDIIAVLEALRINRPVLVGHSLGGEELSAVGSRHPGRVAGLIYLDAAYQYAYYERSQGFLPIDLQELKSDLANVTPDDILAKRDLVQKLQDDLPELELDLKTIQKGYSQPLPLPPMPSAADSTSVAAFRAWEVRTQGFAFPEAEIRQRYEINPDGSVGKRRNPSPALVAMMAQVEKYNTEIRVPVLAIYADPQDWGTYKSVSDRDIADANNKEWADGVAKAFQAAVPRARVVMLGKTNHYIYMANESTVLREMRTFLSGLY